MHRHVPDRAILDENNALDSTTFFEAFLATCHIEQKRLEYACLHLFTSPASAMPDKYHAESVEGLLITIKQLVERYEQNTSNLYLSINTATNALQALMRQKLGVQLYSMFPRMLFLYCPQDRRLRRWTDNAALLAAQAILLYQSAWLQSGWLGDHLSDAFTLAELLAAYVSTGSAGKRTARATAIDDLKCLYLSGHLLGLYGAASRARSQMISRKNCQRQSRQLLRWASVL